MKQDFDKSIGYADSIFDKVNDKIIKARLKYLIGLNYLKKKSWLDASSVFNSLLKEETPVIELVNSSAILNELAIKGKNLSFKQPILSGVLSTIVPGSGKIYCSKTGDGLYSFILICSTGWQSISGFEKDGKKSVRGWLFGSLCSIFYLGNVYGSVISAQVYNSELENNLMKKIQIEIELNPPR
jgi:TM2 domain-containing membrane protein YozV